MKKSVLMIILITSVLFTSTIVAGLDLPNEIRLGFQHILDIKEIHTEPSEMIPGNSGNLSVEVYNGGDIPTKDIRVKLNLPNEISFTNDVSEKKILEIKSGQSTTFKFNIIALPKTSEGVYKASLTVTYLNKIGEEREDNYSIGIVVKSSPKVFAQVEKTDIYDENRIGDTTITFTNDNIANIKLMTAELKESSDYEIISENRKYIGDLDSGDFQSATFRIKVNKELKKIVLPVKIEYKDSLNQDYSEELQIPLNIRTANELGISSNNYWWILVLIIVIILGVYSYKKDFFRKGKHNRL
ncbi:Uncharacterised protein [uncultured archaeon]|nr:Uncharacterised protein [uncultured archaeon]